jgi:hypothetical protein
MLFFFGCETVCFFQKRGALLFRCEQDPHHHNRHYYYPVTRSCVFTSHHSAVRVHLVNGKISIGVMLLMDHGVLYLLCN